MNNAFAEVFNAGAAATAEGRFADALPLLLKARDLQPGLPRLYDMLGVVLFNLDRVDEAYQAYQTSIFLSPFDPNSYNNIGVIMNKQERHGEALAYFNYAALLHPKSVNTLANIGDSYIKLSKFKHAATVLEQAHEIDPKNLQVLVNYSTALWGLNEVPRARGLLHNALTVNPEFHVARKNIGIMQLMQGEYDKGWDNYEARLKSDTVPELKGPKWEGGDGRVGVYLEQGLGDHILHASMLRDFEQCAVWQTDNRLLPLFQRSFPDCKFVASAEEITDVDYHTHAGSLGKYLRRYLTDFTGTPYLLADKAKTEGFRERLGKTFTVGISWASIGTQFAASKFIPLEEWRKIFGTWGVQFLDLQYHSQDADRATYPLINFPDVDRYADIDSLASMIDACDLVITISNVTAHLAAAMGKKTWVIVPSGYGKFWYWGDADATVTPWYQSVRLFRHRFETPWHYVMDEVATQLQQQAPGFVPVRSLGQVTP